MTVMLDFCSALFFHALCTFSLVLLVGTLHFHFLFTATWHSENHGINDFAKNSVERNKKKKKENENDVAKKLQAPRGVQASTKA